MECWSLSPSPQHEQGNTLDTGPPMDLYQHGTLSYPPTAAYDTEEDHGGLFLPPKTTGTARGAAGVLIYEISKQDDRDWVGELAMMFSVPSLAMICVKTALLWAFLKNNVYCDEQALQPAVL
ncbi:hypothetical protein NFI96_027259, partial [Prochilodus magdalenae]